MIKKKCLIIDDEDQSAEIERLISIGSKKGLEILCEQFNVGGQKRQDLLEGNTLSKEKILLAFKAECRGFYDLIAFDYQLQADGITGIDLVKLLGPEKKTSIKIVYSGMLDGILKDILNTYSKKSDFKKAKANLVTIFTAGVSDYVERIGRKGYEEVLIEWLQKKEFTTERVLVKKLEEYGDFNFRSTYPLFNGKKLAEIAAEIDRVDDGHSERFQLEIIEQAISFMIELNSKPRSE